MKMDNTMTTMTTMPDVRPDKHLARAVFAKLRAGPRTISRLIDETGYAEALLRSRLQRWCEEGRCIGRIVGGDDARGFVIKYRMNEAFVEGGDDCAAAGEAMQNAA